jgi:predicted ester cyclase
MTRSTKDPLLVRARALLGVFDDDGERAEESRYSRHFDNPKQYFTPDYQLHVNGDAHFSVEGHEEEARQLVSAIRPWTLQVDDEIGDGTLEEGRVAIRWTASGAHLGPYAGIEPTGRQVSFSGVTIHRFEHGLEAERWIIWDTGGLLRQLSA